MSGQPFDLISARNAARNASLRQEQIEKQLSEAHGRLADAERVYRQARSKRTVELRAEGVAVGLIETTLLGEPEVSRLRYERDIAAGTLDVIRQSIYRCAADRRNLDEFISWSMRIDVQLNRPEGQTVQTIGRKQAA